MSDVQTFTCASASCARTVMVRPGLLLMVLMKVLRREGWRTRLVDGELSAFCPRCRFTED